MPLWARPRSDGLRKAVRVVGLIDDAILVDTDLEGGPNCVQAVDADCWAWVDVDDLLLAVESIAASGDIVLDVFRISWSDHFDTVTAHLEEAVMSGTYTCWNLF